MNFTRATAFIEYMQNYEKQLRMKKKLCIIYTEKLQLKICNY